MSGQRDDQGCFARVGAVVLLLLLLLGCGQRSNDVDRSRFLLWTRTAAAESTDLALLSPNREGGEAVASGTLSNPPSNRPVKVCISPGHPSTPGDKLYEAVLNRKVAFLLQGLLMSFGADTLITVDDLLASEMFAPNFNNEDQEPQFRLIPMTPEEKAEVCNRWEADFLISVHHNYAYDQNMNHSTVLYEVGRDYEERYPGAELWAELTGRQLRRALDVTEYRVRGDYSLYGTPLILLAESTMIGILTEASFYSNPDERERLNNDAYLAAEAEAIFNAFVEFYNASHHGGIGKGAVVGGADDTDDAPDGGVSEGAIRPNEAGQIMVLMYHDVRWTRSKWVRTPKQFKNDLARLVDAGYRPLSLRDFVTGHISTPRGYSPIVLTFDDGARGQFNISGRGKTIDPHSAVGILEAFRADHPEFDLEATFFLSGTVPFGQQDLIEYKLNYLVSRGMDIGNHTMGHHNLNLPKFQNRDQLQKTIGGQANFLREKLTQFPDYAIDTFALCYGQRPQWPYLRRYLKSGEYDGRRYENIAVLNVGGGPSVSPYDRQFKPMKISRIRAHNQIDRAKGLYDWLYHFEKHPELRFISDGDERTVTVPKTAVEQIDRAKLGQRRLKVIK